jgi:DNA phosphorothioation-associated putative methyltransferase
VTRPPKKDLPKPAIDVGKRIGGSLYVHRDAVPLIGDIAAVIDDAEHLAEWPTWNVAKIEKSSVSLLLYESFDKDFPALLQSVKITLPEGKTTRTNYAQRSNPPILHRKELLLPPDDPRLPHFRSLTRAAEDFGLFANPNKIGTRSAWNALIAEAGLTLHNGKLLLDSEEKVDVARHRTAIIRRDLSQPMQLLIRSGIVNRTSSLFDYGCGQGEDVAALIADGYSAFGWDPHHATGGRCAAADVVNLGFVLNVIEDQRERIETLKAAWRYTQKALCVAVMRSGKISTPGWKPYRDGVLTSRGTFQKYFQHSELNHFVTEVTGEKPLSLGPCIVVAFRDKELEQEVLLRRHSRTLLTDPLPLPVERPRPAAILRQTVRERLTGVLEPLRQLALRLGRLPEAEDASQGTMESILTCKASWPRAIELLREDLKDDEAFQRSADARRKDMLIHLALMQFPGSPKYNHLPRSLQADIKAFFRSHSVAMDEGRRLLFATGDRDGIRHDIKIAIQDGKGGIYGDHWFRFRSTVLNRLPPRLRVLVGCAEVLQGGVEACDFVDINLESPRISMITCDDPDQEIPFMIERLTVDLGRLKVIARKFGAQTMPIYFKSRFLPANDLGRPHQLEAEQALIATGLFVSGVPEPSWEQTKEALRKS